VGRTVSKVHRERDYDEYVYKDTKQKRKSKFELKRFKNYNPNDYMEDFESEQIPNKKFKKAA
jgi:hypothetical protein